MTEWSRFEALLSEGNSEPTEGWDFSWLNGRATEGRPSWKYLESLSKRMDTADAVLDVQTGGGERFAEILSKMENRPEILAATESWPPNVEIARHTLGSFGATVVEVPDDSAFPFDDGSFDLVCSRHPTVTVWEEIKRVLGPGGTYFSQQIGAGTNSELTDFFMGRQPISGNQRMDRVISLATVAGLEVLDARDESLPVIFFDIGAVIYFLRKVIWTVPDFSVEKYRDRLMLLHERIEHDGSFTSHSRRFIVEAKKPAK
jgi:SAM-dependent methyltransferase